MKVDAKDRITVAQTAVIVTNFLLGTGILTLPRTSVEKVKTPDVWLTVLLGGLVAIIVSYIMVKLSRGYPDKTFYEYNREIVGKWAGGLISLLLICYFLAISGFQIRSVTEVIQFFLLEGTPIWASATVFLWCGFYLLLGGINPIARLFELIFPITVIIFLLVAFMSIGLFDIDNLRPVLGKGIIPVMQGIKTTTFAYTGIEIMLIIVPFMKQPEKAFKAVLIGTVFPIMFYMITVIMVIGALSVDGVVTRTWPTIDLMRSFEIPGLIFERFESLLLVIWIMQIYTNLVISYYAAALGLSQLFKKDIKPIMFGLLPVVYLIAMIPKNVNQVFQIGDLIGNSAIYLCGTVPLLLLLISKARRKKDEANH
ncbi:spore germination protein [Bacillus glycinifermentans]|uniref:spore germination protein n=1 Tax=Bacillus glycinifermentans TaxID=1664069 RepID=UPI0022E2C967|nr:spore germination protein [Bacillus glycinifermentans]